MVDVPDHLAPANSAPDCRIHFAGLDVLEQGSALFRFDINQGSDFIGTLQFVVPPDSSNSVDSMIVAAHQEVNDVLRTMLYKNETLRLMYEKRLVP